MGKKATLFLIYGLSIIFTVVIAVATVFAANAGKLFGGENLIASFMGLVLPGMIVLNICYFLYWAIRRRWLICLIPLAAVAGCYNYYGTLYRFGDKTDAMLLQVKEKPQNLRILTYNTHHFAEKEIRNAGMVKEFLETQNIDIACFQEFSPERRYKDTILAMFSKYPYSFSNFNTKEDITVALFSKYPIIESKYTEFPFSEQGYMQTTIALCNKEAIDQEIDNALAKYKAANDTTILWETPLDSMANACFIKDSLSNAVTDSLLNQSKKITIFTIHLQSTRINTTGTEVANMEKTGNKVDNMEVAKRITTRMGIGYKMRAEQINILSDSIRNNLYPVILCGDFNDTPLSYVYNTATSLLTDGFRESGQGYIYTYKYYKKIVRIDYILHSKDFKSVKYFSPDKNWSDHNPVISELEIL